MLLTPGPPVARFLDVPLKDETKGWENSSVIWTPTSPWVRVRAGFCDSSWSVATYPTQLSFPPALPVPWFLTAVALASLLPKALSGSLFRTVRWEVRARLYLGFGPCT